MTFFSALLLVLILFFRKKIAIAIGIIKEASSACTCLVDHLLMGALCSAYCARAHVRCSWWLLCPILKCSHSRNRVLCSLSQLLCAA
jgi:Na+-transporting methylmalonyl-CoA/oxaloacetate decarboxylase beta subunit